MRFLVCVGLRILKVLLLMMSLSLISLDDFNWFIAAIRKMLIGAFFSSIKFSYANNI